MILASNPNQTYERQREIILRVVMCNFALAVLKLSIGLAGYSKLVLVDGVFSFVNGMMLLLMWPGYEMENRKPDDRHPYGYGKILLVIAFVVGILFLLISIYTYSYAINNMTWDEIHRSNSAAMMVSIISIAGNIALFHYLKQEGDLHPGGIFAWGAFNNALAAQVSFLVLIFIILSTLGLFYMERAGVIVISLILFGLSIRTLIKSSSGIMDRAPSQKIMENIRAAAAKVRGVSRIVEIKARHIGTYIYVDLSFMLVGDLTMREANEIAHRIEVDVARAIPFLSKEVNAIVV